jgi:predicted Zn-dependent protease with MMP-like domain
LGAFVLFTAVGTRRISKRCGSTEAEVRNQIKLTVIHEFGHYFGMDEEQLKNV